jgi:hypothetical protein
MATLFQCPDCHAIHDGPAEARYVIAVRCEACLLDREFEEWRAESDATAAPAEYLGSAA